MNKVIKLLALLLLILFSNSCVNYYYACSINAYGHEPTDKSYYVNVSDSLMKSDLNYASHIQSLKNSLNRIGYSETTKDMANIIVDYGFYIEDVEYSGTTTVTTQTSVTNATGSIKKSESGSGINSTTINGNSIVSNSVSNNKTKYGISAYGITNNFGETYSSANYRIPIKCVVKATDAKSNNNVWQIEISDFMYHTATDNIKLRICVPWMITVAEPFIGKDAVIPRIELREKDGVNKYGLIWNYELFSGFAAFPER